MSGAEQYPSHQHSGNSHDRIFGGFTNGEATLTPSQAKGKCENCAIRSKERLVTVLNGAGGVPTGRRRRWVRTRTQHLSSLSLQSDLAGDHAALPQVPPPAPAEDPACSAFDDGECKRARRAATAFSCPLAM